MERFESRSEAVVCMIAISHAYAALHLAVARDNGINKRITGDENPERLYPL